MVIAGAEVNWRPPANTYAEHRVRMVISTRVHTLLNGRDPTNIERALTDLRAATNIQHLTPGIWQR